MTIPSTLRRAVLVAGPAAAMVLLGRGNPRGAAGPADVALAWALATAIVPAALHDSDVRDESAGDLVALLVGALLLAPAAGQGSFAPAIGWLSTSDGRWWCGGFAGALATAPVAAAWASGLSTPLARGAVRLLATGLPLGTVLFLLRAMTQGRAAAPSAGWGLALFALALAGREEALRRRLARELAEEISLGILTAPLAEAVTSPWRRRTPGWWPNRRERHSFVEAVLRLANRKARMRGLPESSRRIAQVEVLRLRERIREMLVPVEADVESTLASAGERPAAG